MSRMLPLCELLGPLRSCCRCTAQGGEGIVIRRARGAIRPAMLGASTVSVISWATVGVGGCANRRIGLRIAKYVSRATDVLRRIVLVCHRCHRYLGQAARHFCRHAHVAVSRILMAT